MQKVSIYVAIMLILLFISFLMAGASSIVDSTLSNHRMENVVTSPKSFPSVIVSDPILADTLNSVTKNVTWSTADSWTAEWAPILAGQNDLALDTAITQNVNLGNYADALYVARIADINNYTSQTVSSQTHTALEQMPMCGSLPATFNSAQSYGDSNPTCFLVYTRYILWSYQYAQQYGLTSKWNVTKAFTDFAVLYNKPPTHSAFGEMLFCDPRSNWADSYSSRYYDECAETLSVFLQFAEQGVPGALAYTDEAWAGLQNHWNGQFYEYTVGSGVVECEMGNFAQVIAEYAQQKGGTQNISNWNRVIQDLNYKLLASGWSSPGWSSPGVLTHATINPETRLWETMGAMMALQELYPYFTPAMKSTFQNMLMGSSKAWQGLVSSNLYFNGQFKGTGTSSPSNDATICGAALLFLDGIVPVTGSLAIPIREENYDDFRTQFQSSKFQFDYGNHSIRIPVNEGELTFIYGSTPVSYDFPADGVYDIQFSSDWNQIISVNGQPIAPVAPSAPQNLTANAGDGQVTLSWSAPMSDGGAAITGYNLYRGTFPGGETLLASTSNTLNYSDTNVTNGVTYYYMVSAVNSAGESPSSNEVAATPIGTTLVQPSPPLNLVTKASDGQVTLSWSAPSSDGGSAITNYKIYRGTTSGGETLLETLGNVLAYIDTAVTNGQIYYYQVTAVNSVGESNRSNEANATPSSSGAPELSIDPTPVNKNPGDVGFTFTVDVKIANVADLFGFEINITWDNTLITFSRLDNSSLPTIWPQGEFDQLAPSVQSGPGWVRYAAVATGGAGFTGSGTLFKITFYIESASSVPLTTPIHFNTVKLSDSHSNSITATTADGLYIMGALGAPNLVINSIVVQNQGCNPYANDTYQNGTYYYIPVQVTVKNIGIVPAGSFNVSLSVYWMDGSPLENYSEWGVANLDSEENTTLTFNWHPTLTGYYNLTAVADCHDEVTEGNESDNSLVSASYPVAIMGDINGDHTVNVLDAAAISLAWGTHPGDAGWNIRADLNHDGVINILDGARININWNLTW